MPSAASGGGGGGSGRQQPIGWWPSWLPPYDSGDGGTQTPSESEPEESQPSYVPGGGRPGNQSQNQNLRIRSHGYRRIFPVVAHQ